MRASQEQEAAGRQGGRAAAIADAAAAADGKAEFKELFVSLVDPAGLLDMERCAETVGQMRRVALGSGYREGAKMSSILADIFADTADIVGRPVDDGALYYTTIASRHIMEVLYETAEAYRDGKECEPVGSLEEVRDSVARLRSAADEYREELRGADPPGSGLVGLDAWYKGRICKDVIRKEHEEARAHHIERGHDPIFPPVPRPISEILGDNYDPDISSADMIDIARGKGPPEGYEMVKIENHERWKGRDSGRLP